MYDIGIRYTHRYIYVYISVGTHDTIRIQSKIIIELLITLSNKK